MFYRIFSNQRTTLTHRLSVYLLFFGAFAGLMGCGGSSNRSSDVSSQGLVNPTSPTPTYTPPYTPPTGFIAHYSANFTLAGYTGTGSNFITPPVDTDNTLKVRITAGPGGPLSDPNYSNFVANYGCISYRVTVMGNTRTTQMLSVNSSGGYCPGNYAGQWVQSANSEVLDFGAVLSPGHGPITVEVKEARYDFYCAYYYSFGYTYSPYNNWCPLKSVYRSHTVTGQVEIQVNGF